MTPRERIGRAAAVVFLLGLGLGVQLYFFGHYPQPTVFGDPVDYLEEGQRWQRALALWRSGAGLAAAFDTLRDGLLFSGVGVLYGTIDALRPHDWGFFRVVFALFNTLGMGGAFVLARRLSGSFAGGLAALALAAVHPSFATHTGRLYPDPVTGCLFVWAAAAYVSGVQLASRRWMAAAGVFLMAALLVRSQLMNYVLALLAPLALLSALVWARRAPARRLAVPFLGVVAAVALGWLTMVNAQGRRGEGIHGHLGLDIKQVYPYGFWQYLETDGWEGVFRLRADPYYKALEAEANAVDPELLRSRRKQIAFTMRFVASRAWDSLLLVLDNAYRLYDRPANPYQWDYPFPLRAQPLFQKTILLLCACGLAAFAARSTALAAAFFIPLALALLHGLAFPWPRYGFPAYLSIIGGAGGFVGWIATRRSEIAAALRTSRRLRAFALAAAALLALGAGVGSFAPEGGRGARLLGTWLALALPFVAIAAVERTRRAAIVSAAVWTGVAALVTAHELRDRRWHEMPLRLDAATLAIEQEIRFAPEALARLRAASEAFVVFDLQVPGGDPRDLSVEVAHGRFAGSAILPTMPRLREGTATGGRDRRAYPQWWAVPLTPDLLPKTAAEPLRVRVAAPPEARIRLALDRFRGQQRWYEGPSFGDWPYLVAGKLEYDSDYRIGVRRPLQSLATAGYRVDAEGRRTALRGVPRIRVVTLERNEGGLSWVSAPAPAGRPVAYAFAAFSGARGNADLFIDDRRVLTFPLGATSTFDIAAEPWTLCVRAEGMRSDKPYARYVLKGPARDRAAALTLAVRFRTGMSVEPRYFQLDARRTLDELRLAPAECGPGPGAAIVNGIDHVLDASKNNYPEDTGRWTVSAVY
jgi:hypothetical protein